MIQLSLITITYNDESVLSDFLDSYKELSERTSLKTELIVVDNNSSDGTRSILEKESNVILIKSPENLGFSKANNLGLSKARGKYILFINPDTKFTGEIFEMLITYLEYQTDVGALTCDVRLPDGSQDRNTRRNFPTPWTAFCHFSKLSAMLPNIPFFSGYYITTPAMDAVDIPACGGAFILVRREVVEKINGWDEDFFLYGEDLDFCYRIHENGYRIVYYPQASIVHYGGVSTGIKKSGTEKSRASKEQRLKMAKYSIEAMDLFYKKHYENVYPQVVNKLVQIGMLTLYNLRRLYYQVL